jgi:sodium/bile acid cotransporter 7
MRCATIVGQSRIPAGSTRTVKADGFLISMLGAIALASLFPAAGSSHGPLHAGVLTELGIALVFFLHGIELSSQALRAGAANWRLHLFVQLSTYVLFPLLGLIVFFGARRLLGPEVRLGMFFLCALPSTISSSIAMTSIARGNVAGAVFDATLSGLIGMVLTPVLVGLVSAAELRPLPILPAIEDVAAKLLLPFAAGQLLRPLIHPILHRHHRVLQHADQGVIVLIVYVAFCDAMLAGIWSRYSPLILLEILALSALLLALVLSLTRLGARALRLSHGDEVAAVFCGSKKSLASGAPIAQVLFGNAPALGLLMLPLLMYHQLQLVVCGILARRYAQRDLQRAARTATG